MKKEISVRYRLFILIVSIVFIANLLQYVANAFFAEKYYIYRKKQVLFDTAKELVALLQNNKESLAFDDETLIYKISTLEKSIGGAIFIGKIDGTIFYPPRPDRNIIQRPAIIFNPFFNPEEKQEENKSQGTDRLPRFPRIRIKYLQPNPDGSYFIITKDPNFKIDTLRYQKILEDGTVILVWIPMASIKESVAISSRFAVTIGIIAALLSGIWALLAAQRFTKPILEMSKIAKRMANLDFSKKIKVDSGDEIGQLARSINHLSEKLSQAINELNEKNRRLKEDIDREKKLEKMRREFVSSVSHELKTPLFLIQGYAEALKENIAEDEQKRNFYLDVIIEETQKMDKLVKDLLELSQFEAGMAKIKKVSFDVSKLIYKIASKYKPIAREMEVSMAVECEENLQALADPERIEQVLINFINNALEHLDERRVLKIKAEKAGGKIKVSVYNSGAPIPEASMDKIWQTFYKVDKARTREIGGSGIGLAVVKAIMEAHGGSYGVANAEGGVEFWIEIDEAKDDFTIS